MKRVIAAFGILIGLAMLARSQSAMDSLYIPTSQTWAQVNTSMPAGNYWYGQLALTTDAGLAYDSGSAWVPVTAYLTSAQIVMPTTTILLGCGSASTAAIPNATNFIVQPLGTPGNVNVQSWITSPGTAGATANIAYCTSLASVVPAATTFNIKPFSR